MLQVLLIEDDMIDQLTISRLIKKQSLDCHLTKVITIEKGAELISSQHYDLVICDLNLPDGIAFDLGVLIKKQPFILLSGHLEPESIELANAYGAEAVIQKSSDLRQLTSIQDYIQSLSHQEKFVLPKNQVAFSEDIPTAFDIRHLLEVFDHNEAEVSNILEVFLEENPRNLRALEEAITSKNREQVHFYAHKLKSNYTLIGLPAAKEMAMQINAESTTLPFYELALLYQNLHKIVDRTLAEIKSALTTL